MTDITTLWENFRATEQEKSPIIELQNNKREPIGAIYLKNIDFENMKVVFCETNHNEKYAFYYNGILVYFSYFRKLTAK